MADGDSRVEEVMIGDGQEEIEYHLMHKWSSLDLMLMVLMTFFAAVITFINRAEILRSQLYHFLLMLMFLTYQITSYLICFLSSLVVLIVSTCIGKKQFAYKLTNCYDWLRHLLEITILVYCGYHAIVLIFTSKLKSLVLHQVFFYMMLVMIVLKLFRLICIFFGKTHFKPQHVVVVGGGIYKLNAHRDDQKHKDVLSMMASIDNGKMVSNDEKVHVEGLDLN
jgi:hypothetical protein